MVKLIGFGEWASELARAFGENPKETRSITLYCSVDEAVTVAIEKYVDGENGEKVLQTIKKIAWIE